MIRCLPFKRVLVLTRTWALQNFGLGFDLLQCSAHPVSSLVSSFRHEHIATVGDFSTRIHMQDLIDEFNLINYIQHMANIECMVVHIHLDKNI
jgi:homoserine kinase